MCPTNNIIKYDKPVSGNKIQELQFKKNILSYKTDDINYYSHKISDLFKNNTIYLPTSHNTPIITALQSCRNINSNKYIKIVEKMNITDNDGVFINNDINKNKLLYLLNFCGTIEEKKLLKVLFMVYFLIMVIVYILLMIIYKLVIIMLFYQIILQKFHKEK